MRYLLLFFIFSVFLSIPAFAADEPAAAPEVKPDPLLLRYLNIRGYGAARFSADGSQIAFSSNWTGTSQKWLMPSTGGFPTQITYFEDSIDFADFSPHDPELMWTGVASGGNERTQIYLTSPDGVRMDPLAVDPDVIHRAGDWSDDGRLVSFTSNSVNEQYFDVWVRDLPGLETNLVIGMEANLSAGEFSPNGRYMIVSENLSNVDNNVYLVEVATGDNILLTPPRGRGQLWRLLLGRRRHFVLRQQRGPRVCRDREDDAAGPQRRRRHAALQARPRDRVHPYAGARRRRHQTVRRRPLHRLAGERRRLRRSVHRHAARPRAAEPATARYPRRHSERRPVRPPKRARDLPGQPGHRAHRHVELQPAHRRDNPADDAIPRRPRPRQVRRAGRRRVRVFRRHAHHRHLVRA